MISEIATTVLNSCRVENVSVTFVQNRSLATHDDLVSTVANATLALLRSGYYTYETSLSLQDIRRLIALLDHFSDAYEFRIRFTLLARPEDREGFEDTTEEVVAMMAELVSENAFALPLEDGLTVRVTSMHEASVYSTQEVYDWCRGGILNTYNHEQIDIKVYEAKMEEEWTMRITVLSTGKTYTEGEFVSNLLFTGQYDDDVADFSGIVKVCEDRAMLNDTTCARSTFDYNEFSWPEQNGQESVRTINFTGSQKYGIVNPLYAWDYTAMEVGTLLLLFL